MYFKPLKNLQGCRVLLSNDDGIDGYGLKLLEKIIKTQTDDVWVVAPRSNKSGAAQSLSPDMLYRVLESSTQNLQNEDVIETSAKHYAINGTPADCVRIALNLLMRDNYPDIVITGINRGRNLADDVGYSGTIGAAKEGVAHGIRSIAISQLIEGDDKINWSLAETYLIGLLDVICQGHYSVDTFININFPNIPASKLEGIKISRNGTRRFLAGSYENSLLRKIMYEPEENPLTYSYPDDNIAIKNHITVSALSVNMSDYEGLDELSRLFKKHK